MKKIVIIGPESTGKSTLCRQVAEHYHTLWCPEYAREYLETNGASYTYNDLLTIARGQVALEDTFVEKIKTRQKKIVDPSILKEGNFASERMPENQHLSSNPLLFFDTNLYVMKVWCEYVYGQCHQYIIDQIAERKYDLYLLCNVDLPWVADNLREYPNLDSRLELYNIYKGILENQTTAWVSIHGDYKQRFQLALQAISEL